MPTLKPAELYAELRAKNYRPFYIFAGEETYLMEEAWRQLEKGIGVDSLNRETFFGGDVSVDDIIIALQTMPFLAEKRLLLVKDAQKIKAKEAEKLAEYLKMPVTSSCLVLLWQDKLRKDAKSGLFSAVGKTGAVVEFRALYDRELPSWVVQKVAGLGKRISSDAAQYLVQESGSNLLDLYNEIEKLDLFTGAAKEITVKDVEVMSGHTRQANLNQLAEAIEGKKIDEMLAIVEGLLEEGEIPLKILATIYRSVRRLLAAKSLGEERGLSSQEIKQELHLHPYFDRNFLMNVSRYTMAELQKDLELILQADLELKTSVRPEQFIFEELLLGLSGKRVNQAR